MGPRFSPGDIVEYRHEDVIQRVLILNFATHHRNTLREDYLAWWLEDNEHIDNLTGQKEIFVYDPEYKTLYFLVSRVD